MELQEGSKTGNLSGAGGGGVGLRCDPGSGREPKAPLRTVGGGGGASPYNHRPGQRPEGQWPTGLGDPALSHGCDGGSSGRDHESRTDALVCTSVHQYTPQTWGNP